MDTESIIPTPKIIEQIMLRSQVVRVSVPGAKCCTEIYDQINLVTSPKGIKFCWIRGDDGKSKLFSFDGMIERTPELSPCVFYSRRSSSRACKDLAEKRDLDPIIYKIEFLSLQPTSLQNLWGESENEERERIGTVTI